IARTRLRPGVSAPIGRTKEAASERFRRPFPSGPIEIPSPRQLRSLLISMERRSLRDPHGERSISRPRKEVQARSGFLTRLLKAEDSRRNMRRELRAVRTAKIISRRNGQPAKIGMNRSLPQEYSRRARSAE